jgi:hypothetical protein
MFPREIFFWRAYPFVRPLVFRRWVVFLFTTELAMERGITDDYYTDRRVPSVRPSVIISPTKLIPVTNRISPSVKLFNGVVQPRELQDFIKADHVENHAEPCKAMRITKANKRSVDPIAIFH